MFETFNSPAMYVAIQAVLSLYASGRTTGETSCHSRNVNPTLEGGDWCQVLMGRRLASELLQHALECSRLWAWRTVLNMSVGGGATWDHLLFDSQRS